ncbi:MAG: type II toxin-antitoxin system VapC family toxin [Aeromicrobium sp.]|uniref:type II toxin-antitoxin system VapC family toxin n=1 Tax=Aeromicrobium sp. TaxID=1871063 RepID=UPI0025C1A9D0|nr:type II toxin-antitoxin system VapC family toxin [Aeromicrobium sp.]MCK5890780.1 type II toxin-antitoxin system VapC family toxin [Aeromicrobium sp.]MDF1703252.1 type II toxin-antitoxin system VapC family toxin [Aeromicrobium sp.]
MILLDTSLIIWLVHGESKAGPGAVELIGSHHPVHYSSVSHLEMQIKHISGKLRVPADLVERLDEVGLRQLPFVAEHADAMRAFPELDGHDPFDRALVAQSAAEGLLFLTADRRLLALDRSFIVDATR